MKVKTFAENLFAMVSLVKQEPFTGVPYVEVDDEDKEPRYELKKGDLVLLARISNDKEVEYVILAKVDEPRGKSFDAKKSSGMRILVPMLPKGHWMNHGLPSAISGRPVDGCEYLMCDSGDFWWIYGPSYLTDRRIYIGFENVMQFLLTTPGMEPHAGALAISWMMNKTI